MTVEELIEKLQALPPDADVFGGDNQDGLWDIVGVSLQGNFAILSIEGGKPF